MIQTIPRKARRTALNVPRRNRGILFGTDFSENARAAAEAAAAMARRMGEPLILLHAVELPHLGASDAEALKWLATNRRKDLHLEAEALRKAGADVEERTAAGQPDEVLVNFARTEAPRLLVVSSLGHRRLDRWFLGSVAERVAERATIPTLVVRDPGPLLEWARGKRPLKVFVCCNRTVTSEAALGWMKELLAIGRCEVTVGHVNWPADDWARLGGGGALMLNGNPPSVQNVLERELKAKTSELLGNVPFRIRVEANWGRADYRLAEMAKEEGADLVVVGSHQYHGFERLWHASISRGLLYQASMSVALVPLSTNNGRAAPIPPPLRRALVTTDFSELANAAIPQAYALLRGGGTVHLLHVVRQPRELSSRSKKQPSALRANSPKPRHFKKHAAKLRALIPAEAEAHGLSTEIEVVACPDVAEGICQAAERLGVDVICLGTHGRSGLAKALLGSVAQNVIAHSRRPLFVVRAQPR